MPVRGLLAAAVILAALSGAVWWSERHPPEDKSKGDADRPKLVSVKDDEISRLEITHKDSAPVVLQKEKGAWKMAAPQTVPVDNDAASGVASAMTGLTWDRLVEEKGGDPASFGLASPAVQVSVTGSGNKKQTLQIGDETPTSGGFFAKLAGDPRIFSINTGTKSSLDKSWKDLQDKRLLTFDDTKLSRVELAAKGQKLEFGRSGGNDWQVLKPRTARADNLQVDELVRKLHDARMDTSVSDEDEKKYAAGFGGAAAVGTAAFTGPAGTQSIEIRKLGEDYLAKSSAVDGVRKITKDVADALDKKPEDFLNKKLFDFGFSDPSKIDVRDEAKTLSFLKSGEKWWLAGKEMDPTSVQSLIDKLRDAAATKVADTGFTTAVLELAVTSNEGKKVEKVSVSKGTSSWFAKRENDPSVYELENKTVDDIRSAASDVKAPPPPPAPAKK